MCNGCTMGACARRLESVRDEVGCTSSALTLTLTPTISLRVNPSPSPSPNPNPNPNQLRRSSGELSGKSKTKPFSSKTLAQAFSPPRMYTLAVTLGSSQGRTSAHFVVRVRVRVRVRARARVGVRVRARVRARVRVRVRVSRPGRASCRTGRPRQ